MNLVRLIFYSLLEMLVQNDGKRIVFKDLFTCYLLKEYGKITLKIRFSDKTFDKEIEPLKAKKTEHRIRYLKRLENIYKKYQTVLLRDTYNVLTENTTMLRNLKQITESEETQRHGS